MDFNVIFLNLSKLVFEAIELVIDRVGQLLLLNRDVGIECARDASLSVHLRLLGIHVGLHLFDLILQFIYLFVHSLLLRLQLLLLAGLQHLGELLLLALFFINEALLDVVQTTTHLLDELVLLSGVTRLFNFLKIVLAQSGHLEFLLLLQFFHALLVFFITLSLVCFRVHALFFHLLLLLDHIVDAVLH